jgi:WD40 repeat protein
MMARSRLGRDGCVEAIARLEGFAASRPALLARLRRLRLFLSGLPESGREFPLLAAAQAVNPDDPEPVAAFREFRRLVARFAAAHGIDLVLVVDGQKRAPHSTRSCWMEGTDGTDQQLSDLSAASTAALSDTPVVPSYGRPERDGKTVVRTYFDIAPADREAAERCVGVLMTRLSTDREYVFDRIPPGRLGDGVETARAAALASADLVVVFLSPHYLRWSTDKARGVGPALNTAQGRVAPVCWSMVTDRSDLGPYSGTRVFVAGDHESALSAGAMPGLDRLRPRTLDDQMAVLHTRLAELVTFRRAEPVDVLAHYLAASDELHPVTARAVRAQLDKGVIPSPLSTGPAVDVVEHLVTWATSDGGRPYFVVFGEYGMGKTIATQTLTRELLSRRDREPSTPLPIYFDLRLLGTEVRKRDAMLQELLADLIKRAWRTGEAESSVTPADVITAVQHRRAVVIFDGLDEVLVHMSEQQGQGLLRELLRILPPQLVSGGGRRPDAGRVVLTCRTHFFRTIRDQHTFFRAQDRDGVGPDLYEALHLLPFDDAQIRAYLEGKQGVAGVDKAIELIRSVHDLAGLATRPYNLRLICEQLGRLERRIAEGGSIDAAGLYDELVQSWLERDTGKHQFERDHKVRLMEDLAALLWRTEARRIRATELEAWLRARLLDDEDLRRWVQLARPDPAVLAEDLRTATFIVRPGSDEFEFAHTSLLEYFLARFLHRTMRDGHSTEWRLPAVSNETLDFLVEIASAHDPNSFVGHLIGCGKTYQALISEHVVKYALRATERGAPAPSLRGFQLATADLRGLEVRPPPGVSISMAGCGLARADLRNANLHSVCLDNTDLRAARLTQAELHHCSLRGANLEEACLDGAIIRSTRLHGAKLDGASGEDSQWLWCKGRALGNGIKASLEAPTASLSIGPTTRLEVLAGPTGRISSVAWSRDGVLLAASDGVAIHIWNPTSGAEHARLVSNTGWLETLVWSPDGSQLAGGGDGAVRVWDPADPGAPPAILADHTAWVGTLAWSPDGSQLAGGGDGAVRVWDPADPGAPPAILADHTGWLEALAWSPDGSRLAGGGGDGVVRVWDPADPEASPAILADHTGWLSALAWSPDGSRLAGGGGDGVVRVWDPADPGAPPAILAGGTGWLGALAWSRDGTWLAGAGHDGVVRVWDPADPGAPPAALASHTDWVQALAWSPEGTRLASAGEDRAVRVWDSAEPGTAAALLAGHTGSLRGLAWSPDGTRLASGGSGGTVRLWDPADPGPPQAILSGHNGSVWKLAWSPDEAWLASGGSDGVVRLWDPANPGEAREILSGHNGWVWALAWSPDGAWLASGGEDGIVRLWDLADPCTPKEIPRHVGSVWALAWSPKGARLASAGSASAGGVVRVLDPGDPGAPAVVLAGHTGGVPALAWSPDGARLASGGYDGVVLLWNLADPGAPAAVLAGHTGGVLALAWSPDGARLASGGYDGVVLLWNLADPGAPAAVLARHAGGVWALAWSPDGARLASVGDGGALWLHDPQARSILLTIQHFRAGAWCVLGPNNRPFHCEGEVWRWLRWRHHDPLTGGSTLLPAEYFGPLPGIGQPS